MRPEPGTNLLKTLAVPVDGRLRPSHPRRCTGSGPECPGAFGTVGTERSPVGGRRRASASGRVYSAPFRAYAAITRRIRVTGVPLCICEGATTPHPQHAGAAPPATRRATGARLSAAAPAHAAHRVEAARGFCRWGGVLHCVARCTGDARDGEGTMRGGRYRARVRNSRAPGRSASDDLSVFGSLGRPAASDMYGQPPHLCYQSKVESRLADAAAIGWRRRERVHRRHALSDGVKFDGFVVRAAG